MQQLKTWFRWRATTKGRTHEKKNPKAILELFGASRTRTLQQSEMYSKLYWGKIKPKVQEEIDEARTTTRGEKLNIVKRVTKDMWDAESEEVKAVVITKLAQVTADKEEAESRCKNGLESAPEDYLA